MSDLLTVTDLTMKFEGLTAVDNVSFTVKLGSITAIIGPNGAGKTTVFNCINSFYKPSRGQVILKTPSGKNLALHEMPPHKVAKKGKVLRTFQNIRLFNQMTVLENVLVGQYAILTRATSTFSLAGLLNLSRYRNAKIDAIDLAMFWIDAMGLREDVNRQADSLSYGAKRRLEIARCLAAKPHLLCLDEPVAGLNPRESNDLKDTLKKISNEHNVTILLIEHDMSVVMGLSDHIVVLDYGRLLAQGKAESIRNNPDVIRAYLGD